MRLEAEPMSVPEPSPANLIPPPRIVRERLAKNLRESRLLRSLLRLSRRAAEERADADPQSEKGVDHAK